MMVRVPPGHVWLLGDNPQNSKGKLLCIDVMKY